MIQYEIIVMSEAEKDLRNIFEYIATEFLEPQTAINMCDRIQKEILNLDTMPNRHPIYRNEPWYSRGVRFFTVGNFLVFYIVSEETATVHVLRIIYSGRNMESQLQL